LLESASAKSTKMVDHSKSNPLAKQDHNKPITKIVEWIKKQKMLSLHHHKQCEQSQKTTGNNFKDLNSGAKELHNNNTGYNNKSWDHHP
jgi:hypothetical protein